MISSLAVVLPEPRRLELRRLELAPREPGQVAVALEWSAVSTGTERLLWAGEMPAFPGLGYPLVPGYESVGRVIEADASCELRTGDRVFVPGANCFGPVRGLFGGAASRLHVPAARVVRLGEGIGEAGVLLALAATARHALAGGDGRPAELIVGHGALGRLLARLAVCDGGSPVVWEKNPARAAGAVGYRVLAPGDDPRRDYRSIYDVSGDASLLEPLLGRLGRGGEIVLAGFYAERLGFAFPPAFLVEARLRVAAEWRPDDLAAVLALVEAGRLDLGGLITHRRPWHEAADAYPEAFDDPACLKMLLDWRTCS